MALLDGTPVIGQNPGVLIEGLTCGDAVDWHESDVSDFGNCCDASIQKLSC